MKFAIVLFAAGCVAGCATRPIPTQAWEHFDACSAAPTFHEMVACGKAARQRVCEANQTCSPTGDTLVEYIESLDQSVQHREMSEPEARRRWIEFKMARINERRQAMEAARAAQPVVCNKLGTAMICN